MITNFEEITSELNELELTLVPVIVEGFKARTDKNPIKAPEIIKTMNVYLVKKNIKLKMTGPRLRKFCNYIRRNSIIPLIATSKGYYVSYEKDIVMSQIESLNQRASSIESCARGMDKFLFNK